MILTSKRCFLNKFIQMYPAEVILNANYYMADDGKKQGNKTNVNPNIRRNEYGEIVEDQQIEATYTSGVGVENMGSMYHVRRSNILNPEGYNAEYVMGGSTDGFNSPEERYINHLQKKDTMISVYNFLFGSQLQGNGLQILIFEDAPNIKKFGHIMCQFLSMTYGVDIIFLDPAYRPDCRGQVHYMGNKQQGIINSKFLNDCNTVAKFEQAVSQSEYHHSLSNIQEYLGNFNAEELMNIYNLLFPDAPLPQGNYTEDQLREILIYRATAGRVVDASALANVLVQNDWDAVLSRMSSEAEDFGLDDTGLF